MSAQACRVGALMRDLIRETPAPPPPGSEPVEDVLERGRRVMMARQALFSVHGGLSPHQETHAECEALAAELRVLEDEWQATLNEARKQVSTQLRHNRQLRRFKR